MQFSGNFGKIVCWRPPPPPPPPGVGAPPLGNPGSATAPPAAFSPLSLVNHDYKQFHLMRGVHFTLIVFVCVEPWSNGDYYITGTVPGTGIGWGSMLIKNDCYTTSRSTIT